MATRSARKTGTKRSVVSFKDIQIAYLLDGTAGVEKLIAGRTSAGPVLRRALADLKTQGRSVEALEGFIAAQYGPGAGRGRALPAAGDERSYKAQQIKTGGAFLRLPLHPLGVGKGGKVRVRFEPDRIIVSKG